MTNSVNVTAAKNRLFLFRRFAFSLFLFTAVSVACADDGGLIQCAPASFHAELNESFSVDYIHDGDTLWLSNGQKIRLIGLNAPEVAHRNKPAEPFGTAARDALRGKIGDGAVYVETDAETHDRFGRQLAHIFLSDKTNLAAWLLAHGFAMAIAVPPNLKYQDCYRSMESLARSENLGIWADAYFAPTPVARLSRSGFMRVQGCVKSVFERKGSLVLKLSEQFHLRVPAKDRLYMQPLFDNMGEAIADACVVARGWVYNERRTEKRAMKVRYPDAVEFSSAN